MTVGWIRTCYFFPFTPHGFWSDANTCLPAKPPLGVSTNQVLRRKGGQIGVAGVCNGGGGASAMVIEAESLDHSSAHAHL
ncbi:unnamed protein product [Closterium sp. NIES-53]